MGALVPAQQQSNPYAVNPYGQQPPAYGAPAYGAPPQNPYGYPPQQPYGQPAPPPPAVDPFSVFESQALVPAAPPAAYPGAPPVVAAPAPASGSDDDFWGGFGGNAAAPPAASEAPSVAQTGEDGLPPGGEWYDAKIFTPTLGVMFFKPQELTDSLFLNTDKAIVDALGERPVVAFIVEGSSARAAGVELGHVLLKVNGVDVKNPKDASRLIKEGPRPLPLLFYVPNTDVVVAEGEHMVKYDTRDTIAPNSAKEWKPKYVVIGGIIAQPWMMNMYRSKVSCLKMKRVLFA
jgi:membrane-associated protease RseP (regulator of RpoE activity)